MSNLKSCNKVCKPDMAQTKKRIEVVKLLHELRHESEATGDVFLRGLRALKALDNPPDKRSARAALDKDAEK